MKKSAKRKSTKATAPQATPKATQEISPSYGLLAASVLFVELPKDDRLLMLRWLWRLIPKRDRLTKRLAPARAFAPFELTRGAR